MCILASPPLWRFGAPLCWETIARQALFKSASCPNTSARTPHPVHMPVSAAETKSACAVAALEAAAVRLNHRVARDRRDIAGAGDAAPRRCGTAGDVALRLRGARQQVDTCAAEQHRQPDAHYETLHCQPLC